MFEIRYCHCARRARIVRTRNVNTDGFDERVAGCFAAVSLSHRRGPAGVVSVTGTRARALDGVAVVARYSGSSARTPCRTQANTNSSTGSTSSPTLNCCRLMPEFNVRINTYRVCFWQAAIPSARGFIESNTLTVSSLFRR